MMASVLDASCFLAQMRAFLQKYLLPWRRNDLEDAQAKIESLASPGKNTLRKQRKELGWLTQKLKQHKPISALPEQVLFKACVYSAQQLFWVELLPC